MSRKYKFLNSDGVYFVSFAIQQWIDLFIRNEYKDILVENLIYCQNAKGLQIFAWCIMTSHVHMVIQAKEKQSLPEILRDFKSYTSKQLIVAIGEHPQESRKEWLMDKFWNKSKQGYRVWRGDNHPIELWSNSVIDQKIDYIHNNPVKAGIVMRSYDYVYSSARDYAGDKGMLKVIIP